LENWKFSTFGQLPGETKRETLLCGWQSLKTLDQLSKALEQLWYGIAVRRSKFSLNLNVSAMRKRLGCEIYLRGINAKQAFKLLSLEKLPIEAETGPLEWQELPDGQDCRIVRYKTDFDPNEKSTWQEDFKWLKNEAELFHKVFSPRIKGLPIEDEETETEEAQSS
jgi:hypothetical protein